MKLLITGTPGTGKSSLASTLESMVDYPLFSIHDLLEELNALQNSSSRHSSYIIDEDEWAPRVVAHLEEKVPPSRDVLVEGHMATLLSQYPWDLVVVLRTHPRILQERLRKRGYAETKVVENVEAEVLSVIAGEIDQWGLDFVAELTTHDSSLEETAQRVLEMIQETKVAPKYRLGRINWLDSLSKEGILYEFLPLDGWEA